jgi:RHS repeat-associated protein
MTHGYDGDGLRAKKTESGAPTYSLRSSVLGGQVVAELIWWNNTWAWNRGYVYAGSQLLAVQQSGVFWMHEDPITKSKRVTNSAGTVVSSVETDPWGANTNRNVNSAFQPNSFTSYLRDADGGDEAMMRRYGSYWSRFSQPDPYDGSYSLSNPQSFNRYAYTLGDPVNFVDPNGLDIGGVGSGVAGGGIGAGAFGIGPPPSTVTIPISFGSPIGSGYLFGDNSMFAPMSPVEGGGEPGGGGLPQKPSKDKEIQRRIAEGQAWDKWYAWVNCNTPIMNKYNAQIDDFLKIGGEAFWWEVGGGIGAATTFLGAGFGLDAGIMDGGPPVGAWGVGLIIVGVHSAERRRINDIKSNYQKEVTKNCGPKPPHP